ncbi:MAG: UDP-N-acetylglucosamine--N-acetylmuramyl-(pentapeptide) pyrophosphoryl-undecaprenol N-acetylglucosamine transferase [Treponema sp.]|nr:UDP-N-acetylglucosamine--N-acetylmuramyl-(pentapeptide) pyrophosphoryl-undecaprenol N-acetylglucosamine transferase [Treponema sp.]
MKKQTFTVVFAGGGTGGHIYPGIAVADETRAIALEKGIEIKLYWIGNSCGMDKSLVEKNLVSEGGSIDAFYGIPSGKLRRYFSLKNFTDIIKIAAGFFKSLYLLIKLKPDCVFSKGGFVSVPPCKAAGILRIPYFTHECDFTPGLATKLNSCGAKNIFISYSETEKYFSEKKKKLCAVTGNPVRPVFYENHKKEGLDFLNIPENHNKKILFVSGGSLGARQINELVMENLNWLKENFIVVHQTGKAFAEENPLVMSSGDDDYKPYAFIYKEMPYVIQAADIVLCRSGANSLWECATCGKPMVLIPLCGSGTRGDQVDNARYFEKENAALVLSGNEADGNHLKEKLSFFLNEENIASYSNAASKMCSGKSALVIAGKILEKAGKK